MRTPLLYATILLFFASFARGAQIDFQRAIQPFFAEYCLECHGSDKTKGGLSLTSRAAALKTLESGAVAIVPGKPEASEMVARLLTAHGDEQMPPPKRQSAPSPRMSKK